MLAKLVAELLSGGEKKDASRCIHHYHHHHGKRFVEKRVLDVRLTHTLGALGGNLSDAQCADQEDRRKVRNL